jgi:hypothetical protein
MDAPPLWHGNVKIAFVQFTSPTPACKHAEPSLTLRRNIQAIDATLTLARFSPRCLRSLQLCHSSIRSCCSGSRCLRRFRFCSFCFQSLFSHAVALVQLQCSCLQPPCCKFKLAVCQQDAYIAVNSVWPPASAITKNNFHTASIWVSEMPAAISRLKLVFASGAASLAPPQKWNLRLHRGQCPRRRHSSPSSRSAAAASSRTPVFSDHFNGSLSAFRDTIMGPTRLNAPTCVGP